MIIGIIKFKDIYFQEKFIEISDTENIPGMYILCCFLVDQKIRLSSNPETKPSHLRIRHRS